MKDKTPCESFELKPRRKKIMTSKIRQCIDHVQKQLFYIYFRLAPRDVRLFQASKIFGEIIDYSAIPDNVALPGVDAKEGGEITAQQLDDMTTGYNVALRFTTLDDFAEWLASETFGVIADRIDKHYYDLSAPDSFSQFIDFSGRSLFKKATKYYLVNLLNATTYHLDGDPILYMASDVDFPTLYEFLLDSRNIYIKARLIH